MKVAGFGFRQAATTASLRAALVAAGGVVGLDALATLTHKATAPAFLALAEELGLPVHALEPALLARFRTLTRSPRIMAGFGTGSIAEAAALAAIGEGGHLLAPRAVSADGMAVAAIAQGNTQGNTR
ncbi:cobalamin biosynthesis protein [Acetobacter sp. TBRC 12305]|uniref:Cobalamin biosynthesis protein n=2 Tax=Acetobacter garciniae TaxID=2817435 RepID=A0A939HLI6_9PROT|nr:cobalamin biosynthesis protein [Acetobacter garciniae]MBO1325712.1 cobalamin biosynthesis protein [Acetobacter garciniae]MBX0345612.1 cobalamin biosynthesis protein [Acetobacter garciniae]